MDATFSLHSLMLDTMADSIAWLLETCCHKHREKDVFLMGIISLLLLLLKNSPLHKIHLNYDSPNKLYSVLNIYQTQCF